MSSVVLVICDGLGDRAARIHMGYLEHLVAQRKATRFTSSAALPTTSRPNYETLHTGVPPATHGVTSNLVVRRSQRPNTFSLSQAHGLRSAASAYSWMSELYVRSPFDPRTDMEVDDPQGDLNHGRFYFSDRYPDEEVFAKAATLTARFHPDYLLVHPMGCDDSGHGHGGASPEYAAAARLQDMLLATAVPGWLAAGYSVVVTSDHGHTDAGGHGGTEPEVVETPLYLLSPDGDGLGDTGGTVEHVAIAATIWGALGLVDTPADAGAAIDAPL